MSGRPRGPTEIVPFNTVIPLRVRNEKWNVSSLTLELTDTDACLKWLTSRGLLRNNLQCNSCDQPCRINAHAKSLDGKRWSCTKCKTRKSLRFGSLFASSHLTLKQIILLMYLWSCNSSHNTIKDKTGITSNHTIIDWCNFMREECAVWLENNPDEIGGVDIDGLPIVVEIDESKYFNRKYIKGHWQDGHWVFCGIERDTGKCFMVEVPDRSAETLEAFVEKYILPGTHIISDGRWAHVNFEQIANGIYTHEVVVHQKDFVYLVDGNVRTENIKNTWMKVKRELRNQFGTSREGNGPSCFHEFVFRNKFRHEDMFTVFLKTITDNYPL